MRQRRLAVVDIGSATVHLLVAQLHPNSALQPLHDESATLLLGARTASSGAIPPDAEADVLSVLRRYRQEATREGAEPLLVVATQAVRAASNGRDVVRRLEEALGLLVAILTPTEETSFSLLGAYEGALPAVGLFADSGGASTQVANVRQGRIAWQRSLSVGASSLTGAYLRHDPPLADEQAEAIASVEAALASLPPAPRAAVPVITGGTARALSTLGRQECPPGQLTSHCLAALEAALRVQASARLASRHHLPAERARILYAGCLILRRLVDWSGAPIWRVSAEGIREGIARAFARHGARWREAAAGDEGGPPFGTGTEQPP